MSAQAITDHPVHLGLGATASVEPLFTGRMDWFVDYEARHASDGVEGRLVSMHTFSQSWAMWEMHPHGCEVVLCISGRMTIHQEFPDGTLLSSDLAPGEYIINQPGTWHTADIEDQATAVFVTAGAGTQNRPR